MPQQAECGCECGTAVVINKLFIGVLGSSHKEKGLIFHYLCPECVLVKGYICKPVRKCVCICV